MELTAQTCAIVAAGIFLASLMDSIAGGGGIISVPVYLLAGLPIHSALGTNKFSSIIGSSVALARFVKRGLVKWRLGLPALALAVAGASLGTRLQLHVDGRYLQPLLLFVLPAVAFVVLRQRALPEETRPMDEKKRFAIVCAAALAVGAYDGFYGPGTGTFFILIFCNIAKLDVRSASGLTKLVNFASGIGAFATSLLAGKVAWTLGAIGAASACLGGFLGSGLAIKNGSKIVRPTVVAVLLLLAAKVAWDFFQNRL